MIHIKCVYPVMRKEIRRRGLSGEKLADILRVSAQCARNKISGASAFTFFEARRMAECFGVDIKELMRRDSESGSEAEPKTYRQKVKEGRVKKPVYPNFEAEMARNGYSKQALANLLHIDYLCVRNRLSGCSDWMYDEVIRCAELFGCDEEYLMERKN